MSGPTGTSCTHEHACLRCNFLQVGHDQGPTVDAIEDDLRERVAHAERQSWLGHVDQLRLTLDHLHDKREQLVKLAAIAVDEQLRLPRR